MIYTLEIEMRPQHLQDVYLYMRILKAHNIKLLHNFPDRLRESITTCGQVDKEILKALDDLFEEIKKECETPKSYLNEKS